MKNHGRQYSLDICKVLGLQIYNATETSVECTNHNCDIEPPAMTTYCPTCEYNIKKTCTVYKPSVDFSENGNLLMLLTLVLKHNIPIRYNDNTWFVSFCSGETILQAISTFFVLSASNLDDNMRKEARAINWHLSI